MVPLTEAHVAVFSSYPAIVWGDVPRLELSYPLTAFAGYRGTAWNHGVWNIGNKVELVRDSN